MREARKVRDCATILDARSLLRSQAAQEYEAARLSEAARREEEDTVALALDAAFGVWTRYIERCSLDPGQLGLLASAIDARTSALHSAEAATAAAVRTTEIRQADYALRNAQVAQAEVLHRRARRAADRQSETKALNANDDRIAYQWSRK